MTNRQMLLPAFGRSAFVRTHVESPAQVAFKPAFFDWLSYC